MDIYNSAEHGFKQMLDLRRFTDCAQLQLVIYGVDGPFVPEENLFLNDLPGSIHNLTHYLVSVLVPGGPEVPITAIIDAVGGGRVAEVAAAFDQTVQAGLSDQLIAILREVCMHFCVANNIGSLVQNLWWALLAGVVMLKTSLNALENGLQLTIFLAKVSLVLTADGMQCRCCVTSNHHYQLLSGHRQKFACGLLIYILCH